MTYKNQQHYKYWLLINIKFTVTDTRTPVNVCKNTNFRQYCIYTNTLKHFYASKIQNLLHGVTNRIQWNL